MNPQLNVKRLVMHPSKVLLNQHLLLNPLHPPFLILPLRAVLPLYHLPALPKVLLNPHIPLPSKAPQDQLLRPQQLPNPLQTIATIILMQHHHEEIQLLQLLQPHLHLLIRLLLVQREQDSKSKRSSGTSVECSSSNIDSTIQHQQVMKRERV